MNNEKKPFLAIPDPSKRPLQRTVLVAPKHQNAKRYIDPPGLHEAIDAAMLLGLPLLITGEPGTGKTQAAYWLSELLGENEGAERAQLLRTDVKSTMSGRDLLYRFDEVARFRDSAAGGTPRPLIDYIEFEALGEAIIRAAGGRALLESLGARDPREVARKVFGRDAGEMHASDLLPGDTTFAAAEPTCRVVLIDELDKAPRDTPNDLLAEIENMAFSIPELGLRIDARPSAAENSIAQRPIVIITSNSERDLPEPFLRRCAFFHIEFPSETQIRAIVAGAIGEMGPDAPLTWSATGFLTDVREMGGLAKKPGTSEFLAWCACLSGNIVGLRSEQSIETISDLVTFERLDRSLGCLVKTKDDLFAVRGLLRSHVKALA